MTAELYILIGMACVAGFANACFRKPHLWLILLFNTAFLLYFGWIHLFVLLCMALMTHIAARRLRNGKSFQHEIYVWVACIIALVLFTKNEDVRLGLGLYAGVVGLSFYALQCIAYLIHSHEDEPLSLLELTVYLGFFPKILCGPVETTDHLGYQLKEGPQQTLSIAFDGLGRIIWGLFKYGVIAARLNEMLTYQLADTEHLHAAFYYWTVLLLYSLQLYFDFSAYADIACGAAQLMGFRLLENFQFPLRSSSLQRFWQQWHISLMSWLRTEVYNPLAFRLRKWGFYVSVLAIVVTFLLSAIWHGTQSHFVYWGLWHAFFFVLEIQFTRLVWVHKIHLSARKVVGFIWVWLVFVLGNVFFFKLPVALIFGNLFVPSNYQWADMSESLLQMAGGGDLLDWAQFSVYIILILCTYLLEKRWTEQKMYSRQVWMLLTIVLILLFGRFDLTNTFIYQSF